MEQSNWIDKDIRLPEMGQGVLICLNTGLITIGYRYKPVKPSPGYSSRYSWQLFGDKEAELWIEEGDQVTHWMHLPNPPQNLK